MALRKLMRLHFKLRDYVGYLCFTMVLFALSISCLANPLKKLSKSGTFISANFIEYNAAEEFIYAHGNISVALDGYILTCKSILYDMARDLLWAEGDVKITNAIGQVTYGTTVFFKDKLKAGIITDFVLKFHDNTLLVSKLANRISDQQAILRNTCFTPCQIPSNGKPIWQVSAQQAHIDFDSQRITYRNLFFEVYKVPVFYTPYFAHPTPKAKAQSGFLVPDYKRSSLRIPFYLRYKPNLDFTLTPRIATSYNLLEFEARHRIDNGSYVINGSYGKTPYEIEKHNKIVKDAKVNRYHIFTSGRFDHEQYQYGFNIKRTSDKAYLKNYYELHDNYLTSKLYLNNIRNYDYLSTGGLYFQGLTEADSKSTDPLILPRIRTKNVIDLNEDCNVQLIIANNSSVLQQQGNRQLVRSATDVTATNHIITNTGHLFNIDLKSRGDIYLINNMPNKIYNINNQHNINNNKALGRFIPELQLTWRHPLIGHYATNHFSVEPIVSGTLGRNIQPKDNKFTFVDTNRYELSEYNLFTANRYSGIDYHEFGRRFSYGLSTNWLNNNRYWSLFIGQLLYKNNMPQNESAQNAGRIGVSFEGTELFYRFRKNKTFNPIMDEIGSHYTDEKTRFSMSFIQLTNFRKYYAPIDKNYMKGSADSANDRIIKHRQEAIARQPTPPWLINENSSDKDTIRQVHCAIEHKLNNSWLIGGELQTNIPKHKLQILYKSIKVTYSFDCVSITGRLYDDYTFDNSRGIKKQRTKTVSIGLKVLNM